MGRGLKQTFFQRKQIDNQQTCEKMYSITNHQGNSNQNHNETPPYTYWNDYPQHDNK